MSTTNVAKQVQAPGLKQVKVDNWGTFFLQRLQQLYVEEELLDLTIKFPTSDITIQAHRLVITTCTDYFMQLERKQRENQEDFDGVLIMPTDMPYECVKSIISFMYTGQLEYWTSEQNALYKTAQKMNMTVLTKLLDAQFNTTALQTSSPSPEKSLISFHKPQSSPKKAPSMSLSTTPLPGRKLPIWRRKIEPKSEVTAGPSRFDLPDAEDYTLGIFSSFDDITYDTKPIIKATDHSGTTEETFNRSSEQDISGKHDTTEDEEEDESARRWEHSDDEWTPAKSSRSDDHQPMASKRARFELEEKENLEKQENSNPVDNINNHAKIIREVLKKYPHLVKNNKNIRLKIMQKESKTSESAAGKTKVSYVVLKSDHLMSGDEKDEKTTAEAETGPWKCHKCDIDEEYPTYYMYRRHMQDVHDDKFDPRVCEHCGYKATKRNILMYHLYTKHNVPPPKSMSFPKCHACSYVALSETLLVRHQKTHNHGPISLLNSQSDEVQCVQCSQMFKDVSELASHEMNTGHGTSMGPVNGKDKGYKCPQCPKVFVKPINLEVHMNCAHKEVREPVVVPTIPLEPSSEAEALSHVASGIAASLGVGDGIEQDGQNQQMTNDGGYLVPEILNNMGQGNYNGHEIGDQQMIMLIDNDGYQQEVQQSQIQPQQLEISSNEQLVMQGTDEGMIVYIHGNEDQSARQVYESFEREISQETEEIVEEVVEEVEEEVHDGAQEGGEQIEEVIQYVEEETEIVEYDEAGEEHQEGQESMMIIEEEHLETDKQKETRELANEWDSNEDSVDMNES